MTLFAGLGQYWYGFKDYWLGLFGEQSGVTLIALGVLVVSIFIITRGKWRK